MAQHSKTAARCDSENCTAAVGAAILRSAIQVPVFATHQATGRIAAICISIERSQYSCNATADFKNCTVIVGAACIRCSKVRTVFSKRQVVLRGISHCSSVHVCQHTKGGAAGRYLKDGTVIVFP